MVTKIQAPDNTAKVKTPQKAPQKVLLLSSISTYFSKNPEYREILKTIINKTSKSLSLRVIDWFVTHYACNNNIVYWINESTNEFYEKFPMNIKDIKTVNLYLEYRSQLNSYTKLHFDPFRRHDRITFILETYPELVTIDTTVGQLNFFRWCFQNHVITYIKNHISEITKSIKNCSSEKKVKTNECSNVVVNCTLKFD